MKKTKIIFSAVLSLVLIFACCSCTVKNVFMPKFPSLNFTADAQINYKSYDVMSCSIENKADGPLTVKVEKPALLSGLSFVCQDSTCKVTFGSFTYDADTNRFPEIGFGNILKQSLIVAKDSTDIVKNDDGSYTVKTEIESGHIEVILNAETYYPEKITIPEHELVVTITNFSESDKNS